MIRIPLSDILEKLKTKGNLSEEEINSRIKKKIDQLSGLISKEGAAHIICNELGIKLFEQTSGKLKIANILVGMRDVEVVGKAQQVFEMREFQSGDRAGKVGSLMLGDDSGIIRLVLWGMQAEKLSSITPGTILKVQSAYVKENNNQKEIHLGDRGNLTINPEGEKIGVIKEPEVLRKDIKNLQDGDNGIEIFGTIVQTYDLRFFPVCHQCGKKALQKPDGMICNTHGTVPETYAYLVSIVLDDGSSNIRSVMFRDQVDALLGKTSEQVQQFRSFPEKFEELKYELLGKQVKAIGRAKRNDMFDRMEFVVQQIFTNPSPEDELKRMGASASAPAQKMNSGVNPAHASFKSAPVIDSKPEPIPNPIPNPDPTPEPQPEPIPNPAPEPIPEPLPEIDLVPEMVSESVSSSEEEPYSDDE